MSTYNPYLHIKSYLRGELSPEEVILFENELERNDDLKKIIANPELYDAISDELINQEISDRINTIQTKKQTSRKSLPIKTILFAIAASILVLISLKIYNDHSAAPLDQLYTQYYSLYIPNNIRGDNSLNDARETLCEKGHAFLESNEFTRAKELFTQSLKSSDKRCIQKSQFYLALLYVKQKDLTNTNKLLQNILSDPNHIYYEKASALLEDLKAYK